MFGTFLSLIVCICYVYSFTLNHLIQRSRMYVLHTSEQKSTYNFIATVPSLKDVKTRINEIVPVSAIESVQFRYIKTATEEVARQCKTILSSGEISFHQLAQSISLCELTREKGGDIGTINILKVPSDSFNYPFPKELIQTVCTMRKGDIRISSFSTTDNSLSNIQPLSTLDWYVVQLIDVQTQLSPTLRKRRNNNYKNLILSASELSSSRIDKNSLSLGPNMNYYIETMGCQMNSADSERIEGQLQELGYKKSNISDSCNLVILNTCSIRDHAEHKVYSYLGSHAARKRKGEDVKIVIAGCVAQQEGENIIKRFPEVDIVMGPQYANRIEAYDGNQVVSTDPAHQTEDRVPPLRKSDVSAWVNVIYGCNERCTYCVVPYTRGVEQSRTREAILEDVTELVSEGYKEVVLLGQNIDSWGRDMTPKQRFADLLHSVAAVSGLGRVRFLTSHPKYMSERVIQAVAAHANIAPCLNVPFQSGDDTVLRNMRRGYTRERYLEIIGTIKRYMPDVSITADCIVGFPGETEEQFENTLSLMESVKFDMLNTAAYSPRPNTEAAVWDAQVDDDIKQDRLQRINQLANKHAFERSQRFLGRVETVLVENINLKNTNQVYGRTGHSRLCYFDGDYNELKGKFVKVLITEAKIYTLFGQSVN